MFKRPPAYRRLAESRRGPGGGGCDHERRMGRWRAGGPVLAAWLAETAGFGLPFGLAGGLCLASAVIVFVAYRSRTAGKPALPLLRSR